MSGGCGRGDRTVGEREKGGTGKVYWKNKVEPAQGTWSRTVLSQKCIRKGWGSGNGWGKERKIE